MAITQGSMGFGQGGKKKPMSAPMVKKVDGVKPKDAVKKGPNGKTK